MIIRAAGDRDRGDIVDLYRASQAATGIPNPTVYSPETLGDELYSRDAIERHVAVIGGKIVGHGLIEHPNPLSIELWRAGIADSAARLIEFGGAFVDPLHMRKGIYTRVLSYQLEIIHGLGAFPVAATWKQNEHVQRLFSANGGREVAKQEIPAGELRLFVFE